MLRGQHQQAQPRRRSAPGGRTRYCIPHWRWGWGGVGLCIFVTLAPFQGYKKKAFMCAEMHSLPPWFLLTVLLLIMLLLFLCVCSGEVGSGKTTLVAKLQGVEEYMKGRGLEYLYFSVHDDDIEGNESSGAPPSIGGSASLTAKGARAFQITPGATPGCWTETSITKASRASPCRWTPSGTRCC